MIPTWSYACKAKSFQNKNEWKNEEWNCSNLLDSFFVLFLQLGSLHLLVCEVVECNGVEKRKNLLILPNQALSHQLLTMSMSRLFFMCCCPWTSTLINAFLSLFKGAYMCSAYTVHIEKEYFERVERNILLILVESIIAESWGWCLVGWLCALNGLSEW